MTSNNTKRSFIASLLALMLCVVMLIGTTFAWFTDTASTGVNSITAGNLGIDLQQKKADGSWESVDNSTIGFVDAENAPIDRIILWEPGCSYLLPELRLVNTGNLALEYIVKITGTSGEGTNGEKLSDVIEVYVGNVYAGTLSEIIAEGDSIIKGKLLAENDEAYLNDEEGKGQIKLTMKTTAGNEYQGLSIDGIKIDVLASQTPHEYDSFNNQYDKDAAATISVENLADFQKAIGEVEDNGTIAITEDMTITGNNGGDLNNTGKTTNIALNGNTVTAATGNAGFGIRNNAVANISGGTVIANASTYTAVLSRYNGAVANVSNMTLGNSLANGTALCARDNGVINVENTVINSTIGGCADANAGTINVKNCTFNQTGTDTDLRSTLFIACNKGIINIDGGDYTGANKGLYIITSGGEINVFGGNFKANEVIKADNTNYENSYPGATAVFNIYGGNFDGKIVVNGTSANTVNIEAGTFKNTGLTLEQFKAYVAEGSTVAEVNGAYVVTK